jgi:hypothetical protein
MMRVALAIGSGLAVGGSVTAAALVHGASAPWQQLAAHVLNDVLIFAVGALVRHLFGARAGSVALPTIPGAP